MPAVRKPNMPKMVFHEMKAASPARHLARQIRLAPTLGFEARPGPRPSKKLRSNP